MKVWTLGYNPFVMGGSVWQPIATEVEPDSGPYSLGKGLSGYLIISPTGKVFIADAETGAFVGPSLAQVRQDIAEGDETVIRQQLDKARTDAGRAEMLTLEQFWSRRFQ